MTKEDLKVVEAMSRYGGSFVQALADACRRADNFNMEIIKKTWPVYWDVYASMAEEIFLRDKDENRRAITCDEP